MRFNALWSFNLASRRLLRLLPNANMFIALIVIATVISKASSFSTSPYRSSNKFSYGVEAERLCKAYRKVCPATKMCVVQHLIWPRKMSFPVCVHEQKLALKSKVCELAPAPGRCAARFRRWYFNVHAGKCSWFTFGGCDGNLNNFRSEEECKRVCLPEGASESRITSNAIVSIPAPPHRKRKLALLSHPAPVSLQIRPADLTEALELKTGKEETMQVKVKAKPRRRRNRRKHRKGKKARRRKGKRHHHLGRPYAELKVRRTSYRPEKAQSDQGGKIAKRKRNKVRRFRKFRGGRRNNYYNNIRLFRILSTPDNPDGISFG